MTEKKNHVWHPYTKFSAGTLTNIVRAEGSFLYDDQGNRYIDAVSSWWCVNLGHSHPAIVDAIQKQTSILQHSILGNLTHPNAQELASRLAHLLPSPDRHVHFASDGSSANEAALKIAIQYFHNRGEPERDTFLSLTEPYHGDTLGAVSVGFMESFHRPFKRLVFPTVSVDPVANDLAEAIKQNANRLAGVILEPLCQGAAGMRMYAPSTLKAAADTCRTHDIPLIIDEIAMGFGRTGKMFAFQHADIDPDIVTIGKGISNGTLPISATIVRDSIYDTFSDEPVDHTFYHGHTFAGNPIASAAALATLDVYRDENIITKGESIRHRLKHLSSDLAQHHYVKNMRTLGMIAAFDVASPEVAQTIRHAMKTEGVLIRPLGNVLYVMPPLNISTDLLDEIFAKYHQVLDQTAVR